jgi:hypothetical protein
MSLLVLWVITGMISILFFGVITLHGLHRPRENPCVEVKSGAVQGEYLSPGDYRAATGEQYDMSSVLNRRLGGVVVSVLTTEPKCCGFKNPAKAIDF